MRFIMILKKMDSKDKQISELEHLLATAPPDKKPGIKKELGLLRSGIKGEKEAAYLIDFDFMTSNNTMVIHDLRLKVNNRVAQIDHLLIHRTLNIFVLETKWFHSKIKITENGDFLRWVDRTKSYVGLESPFAQNERHIAVLTDAFKKIDMPSRMGVKLAPVFHSMVLMSPEAVIVRPGRLDTSTIIKADVLKKTIDDRFEANNFLVDVINLSRFVSTETVRDIGRRLISLHRPATFDYAARFGLSESTSKAYIGENVKPSKVRVLRPRMSRPEPRCRHCDSKDMIVQYGRYGYYFKCNACGKNTAIDISLCRNGHKERIRKEGPCFFRECTECGTSILFFKNPALSK